MYEFYIGIDPGFTGAVGIMDNLGERIEAWDLPVVGGTGKDREFDETALNDMINRLWCLGGSVGLEKPTSRPNEGAHRSHRFGEGIGMLRGLMTAHGIKYRMIPPNLWKGRLGLPGKQIKGANKACAQYLVTRYPAAEHIIYGSRGGIKDGRLDALLIAHWLRHEEQE